MLCVRITVTMQAVIKSVLKKILCRGSVLDHVYIKGGAKNFSHLSI